MKTLTPQLRTAQMIAKMLAIWEESVRATHTFLTEQNIQDIKPQVVQGLKEISQLFYIEESNEIAGFMGIAGNKIEMLFIAPQMRGKGQGKRMVQEAVAKHAVRFVDVNEQNPQATGFYKHMGFEVIGRSDCDDAGNPFPILHMQKKSS